MARRAGVRKTARMNLLTFKRSNMLPEPAEAGEPLVVSIFYHSVAAASRAIELVHRVTNNFEGDLPLDEVGEQAALKTAFADLVVVAAPRADELPPQVKRCLEHAMTLRAGEEVAIVALVDNTHPQLHCSVCEYLKQLCSSAEGCFFSSKTLPLDSCPLTPERIHERAEAGSSVLDGIMRRRLPQF
jgi:hypothetical protein